MFENIALTAVYTLIPLRRIMDYQLMKITYRRNSQKLDKRYNYIVFKNDIPFYNKTLFLFFNNKIN